MNVEMIMKSTLMQLSNSHIQWFVEFILSYWRSLPRLHKDLKDLSMLRRVEALLKPELNRAQWKERRSGEEKEKAFCSQAAWQ